MTVRTLAATLVATALFYPLPVLARLGETEAQSQARYGVPVDGLVGGDEQPLLPGAIERAYTDRKSVV